MSSRSGRKPLLRIVFVLAAAAAVVPSPAVAASKAGGAACPQANVASKDLSKGAARQAVTCLINDARKRDDLPQDSDLQKAAQKHTKLMARSGCFSHRCPGEPDLQDRVRRTGYFGDSDRGRAGEAIQRADDDATPKQIVESWLDSEAHRDLFRARGADDIGVGVAINSGDVFYTVVIGSK